MVENMANIYELFICVISSFEIDFKIHFLVVLRTKGVNITTTKFFVVPKGCFISHLKEILWPTLFMDSLFLYSILTYYKGFKSYIGLIFILIPIGGCKQGGAQNIFASSDWGLTHFRKPIRGHKIFFRKKVIWISLPTGISKDRSLKSLKAAFLN